MITEVEQIKAWFMELHGVSKYQDIKADDGDYVIPINSGVCLVTIKDNTIAGIQVKSPAAGIDDLLKQNGGIGCT